MDTISVKTLKSGYFVFSRKFSRDELSNGLIEAKVLYDTVRDLPILPDSAARIEKEVIIKSIFGTAAIEGNPLKEEDVARIYGTPEGGAPGGYSYKAEKEIIDLKAAYDFIRESSKPRFTLDEGLIKKIHGIVTADIEYPHNVPGRYRNNRVKVGNIEHGGIYTPPRIFEDINTLMREFVRWINSNELLELEPILRAALAHYHLALIHPFANGNGRTARLAEAMLLLSAGIKYAPVMLSNFYYNNIDDYFWAVSNSIRNREKNDVTPFLSFVLRGFTEALKEIKGKVIYYIRKFTLSDFYRFLRNDREITQRQFDLLNLLLDYPIPFTLKELRRDTTFAILYRNVSERTARRDLKSLHGQNLLLIDDGKYRLNDRVLE